ncbi:MULTISPECIES: hypothetical protein [Halomonadaceae]|uniref:Multicopper oxidase n=1 Tax=Modicisalibacter ilicicola DSM 19980 TaxID=1121942 RepID=A0A1M5CZ98_9GAMM|nr:MULTISPECIES: hypothetical protein [Halomonas]SHF60039.1 hypothetical protein SAMN02745148_03083 [Halomonas ilicicola DSM 19980]
MVLNGFDTNFDEESELYAVNTVAHAYVNRPIRLERARTARIYLINVTKFDPVNLPHLHANFYDYYDHGTTLLPLSELWIWSYSARRSGVSWSSPSPTMSPGFTCFTPTKANSWNSAG